MDTRTIHHRMHATSHTPYRVGVETGVPIVARLLYYTADPYAVQATFQEVGKQPVEWLLSREVLLAGLTGSAGMGDLTAWPDDAVPRCLWLELTGPIEEGPRPPIEVGRIQLPHAEVERFLGRTYELVPAGQETDYLPIDDLLRRIMR